MRPLDDNALGLTNTQIDTVLHALRIAAPNDSVHDAGDISKTHLTDLQFIGSSLGTLASHERLQCDAHLALCERCTEELAGLQALGGTWRENELRVERIRDAGGAFAAPVITRRLQTPLRSLVPLQGAFAQAMLDSPESVEFSISSGGEMVHELAGSFRRRNREYYARINVVDPHDAASFLGDVVLLTITNLADASILLQRRIEVGVAVLLGTDIPLTEETIVEARLLNPTAADVAPLQPDSNDPL